MGQAWKSQGAKIICVVASVCKERGDGLLLLKGMSLGWEKRK